MARSGNKPQRAQAVGRGIDLRALGRGIVPRPAAPPPAPEPELVEEAAASNAVVPAAAPRKRPPGPRSKQFLLDALKKYGSHSSECYWQRGGDWCDCGLDDILKGRMKVPAGKEGRADLLLRLGRHNNCGYTFGRDWCDCGFWGTVERIDPTMNAETGRRASA